MTVLAIVIRRAGRVPAGALNLPGKRVIMAVLIFTQMVPAIVLVIPVLLLFQRAAASRTPSRRSSS